MSDLISRKAAIDEVHHAVYKFFDIVEDDDESPITYNDKRLLELNKAITSRLNNLPSADRPKNMIHIDEVYRLIAGHSNYHGDSILSAFTCLVEGKDVKPIAPLDESAYRPTGECRTCGRNADNGGVHEDGRTKCPIQEHYALLLDGYCHLYEPYDCGAKMGGDDSE